MSEQQRQILDGIMRNGPLDLAADLGEQREIFEQMVAGHPLPADVRTSDRELGVVPAIAVTIEATEPVGTILYLHGGAYVIGSARASLGLSADLARRAGATVITIDYRLSPENPYPAALDDALAAYRGLLAETDATRIAVAGESAGGGLAIAMLVAARDANLPMPAAAHDEVEVTLQVTPGVPHVFQAFAELLDEADAALNEAGRFIAASVR